MLGIDNFPVFLMASVALNVYPGPDFFYVLGRSISQGRAVGVAATLGVSTGSLCHTLLGAAGLSSILLASPGMFRLIQYAGAAYLVYQAFLLLKRSGIPLQSDTMQTEHRNIFTVYRQGLLTNILNPKVALFFIALLPQFVSDSCPNTFLALSVLGLSFITTGTLWFLCVAFCAAFFSKRFREKTRSMQCLLRANAVLFLLLALHLATGHFQGPNTS